MDIEKIKLEAAKVFSLMSDSDKLYLIPPFGLGDLMLHGGLSYAVQQKFGKKSSVLILQERFRSLEFEFENVSEKKYLPFDTLIAFRDYVEATKIYSGDNWIWGYFPKDDKGNYTNNRMLEVTNQYKDCVYHLPFDTPLHYPHIKEISEKNKARLRQEYALDKKRTVILAPHYNSYAAPADRSFWLKLVANLNQRGYILYTNVGRSNKEGGHQSEQPLPDTRPMHVTYNESFFIVENSNCLIGSRSGLLDLLSLSRGRIFCVMRHDNWYCHVKGMFPNTPSTFHDFCFDFAFLPNLQHFMNAFGIGGMQIGGIRHKVIPDGSMFWSEDSLLAAILHAVVG